MSAADNLEEGDLTQTWLAVSDDVEAKNERAILVLSETATSGFSGERSEFSGAIDLEVV